MREAVNLRFVVDEESKVMLSSCPNVAAEKKRAGYNKSNLNVILVLSL
jgi:hypothetical protein